MLVALIFEHCSNIYEVYVASDHNSIVKLAQQVAVVR